MGSIPTGRTVENPFIGGRFGFLLWLIVGLVPANRAIRPAEIRQKGLDLVNVHPDFVAAWYGPPEDEW